MPAHSPDRLLRLGLGFWAARAVLAAIDLGVFRELGRGPRSRRQLCATLALKDCAADLLDALVALELLEREGDDEHAIYVTTRESAHFLDARSESYIGVLLDGADTQTHGSWQQLSAALRVSGIRPAGADTAANPLQLARKLDAAGALSAASRELFVERFDFSRYRTAIDIGGGNGELACMIVQHAPQMRCVTLERSDIQRHAQHYAALHGQGRVEARVFDEAEPLPAADIIAVNRALSGRDENTKRELFTKGYAAVLPGGCVVAIDYLVEDSRRGDALPWLLSLNRVLDTGSSGAFSAADFDRWSRAAGFARSEAVPLAAGTSAAIAWKE